MLPLIREIIKAGDIYSEKKKLISFIVYNNIIDLSFPKSLHIGFMMTTAFISMWITNTATTAMMTPIMEAVLKQLDKQYGTLNDNEHAKENGGELADEEKHKGKMVLLSFCKHFITIYHFQNDHVMGI